MTTIPTQARTEYLLALYQLLQRELLPEAPPVETVIMGMSFPSKGAKMSRSMRVGECHYLKVPGAPEQHLLTIHPVEWETDLQVAQILAHEICHIIAGSEAGHGKIFRALLKQALQTGKPTASYASPEFIDKLDEWRKELPSFVPLPEGALAHYKKRKISPSTQNVYECGCKPIIKIRHHSPRLSLTCNACQMPLNLTQQGQPASTDKLRETIS